MVRQLAARVTTKYGYQTWRAAIYLAAVYTFVALFFICASHRNGVMPTQPPHASAFQVTAATKLCTSGYPGFNPWGYAIDTVIPIINIHQTDFLES